jgi:excisionase family DNA binding protein
MSKTTITVQDFNTLPDWLTVPEVRKLLRLSRTSVYEMIRGGVIPHRRFGRSLRVPKSSLRPDMQLEALQR